MRTFKIVFSHPIVGEDPISWSECKRGARSIEKNLPMTENEKMTFSDMLNMNLLKCIEPSKTFYIHE